MKSFSEYVVDVLAIRHNLLEFKNKSRKMVCAVVKADGYGIGAKYVVRAVDDLVSFYAVACFAEAKKLRRRTSKNILVLNWVPESALSFCAENNISVTVFNCQQVKALCKAKTKHKIKIHLAINTGMNRIGFCDDKEFVGAVEQIVLCKNVCMEGIYTHFYNAENISDTQKQNCIFKHYVCLLAKYVDTKKVICHTESSNAYFLSGFDYDMARVGILLYGVLDKNKNKFKEVLSLKSRIVCITKVEKGQSVGYGKSFVAKKDMIVATVPLGYADGIMRTLSKNGYVLIAGKFCKIVGNICMDMFMVDISNVGAKLFDRVVLVGCDNYGNRISANQVADWCGTIGYEVLTNIKKNRFNVKVKK